MKTYLTALACCLLLTSCATIFNSDKTTVFLYTEKPAMIYHQFDTVATHESNGFNAAALVLPRSRESVYLVIESDSLSKKVILPSKTSKTYALDYIYFPSLIIDYNSSRRYTYQSPVIFNGNLEKEGEITEELTADMKLRKRMLQGIRTSRFDTKKRALYFNISLPIVYPTLSIYSPEHTSRKNKGSILGFGGGIDYYYKKNKFFNLTGNLHFAGDIGCGGDRYSDDERIGSCNIHLSHNHRFERFSFGYGLSYTINHWHKDEYIWDRYMNINGKETNIYGYKDKDKSLPSSMKCEKWNYSGMGAVLNSHFYFTPNFYAGIIYKPTFVRLKADSGSPFFYEHQITFDLAFKIKFLSGK